MYYYLFHNYHIRLRNSFSQCWNKRRFSRATARGAKWGRLDVTKIFGNIVLLNSGFHTRKNSPKIIRNLGMGPQKIFVSPFQGWKRLKNVGLKGRKVIDLPGRQHVSYLVVVILTNYTVFSSCLPPPHHLKIFGFLLNGTPSKMLTIGSCLQRQTSCTSQLKRKILSVSVA